MTREQFVENFLETAFSISWTEPEPDATVKVVRQLIESLYDLQQQINELQDKDKPLTQRS